METINMAVIKDNIVINVIKLNEADASNEKWKQGFCLMNEADTIIPLPDGFWTEDKYENGKFSTTREKIDMETLKKQAEAAGINVEI